MVYPEKIFGMSGILFFEMTSPPPVANISGKKILDALFYSESAPQDLAPQLLEASYAPGCSMVNLLCKKLFCSEILLSTLL